MVAGAGPIPVDVIDRMARELDIGRWLMRFALYGDEAVVDHRFAKIKAAFARIEGAEVWGAKCAPEDIPTSSTRPNASRVACRTSSGTP